MEEYSKNILDALPLMLSPETKETASVTISVNMNAMLRKITNIEELRILAYTLKECRIFAEKHNLNGLYRVWAEWNQKGSIILNNLRGNKHQNISNQQLRNNIVERLNKTRSIINQNSSIDTDALEYVKPQLDQIENILISQGSQLFSPKELDELKKEVDRQRSALEYVMRFVDDLLDENNISKK